MSRLVDLLRRGGRATRHRRFGSQTLPDVAVSEWWSEEKIAEYQAERVRWIVEYAWEESPFYREWMRRHGVRPRSVQGPDDLQAIPPVTRPMVQAEHDRILVPAAADEHAVSGGTTGHRLRWARTLPWLELFTACLWRGFGWAGVTPETRVVGFYSRAVGQLSPHNLVIRGRFDTRRVEDDLARIRAFRPEAVYTYASSSYVMARYLLRSGRTLPLQAVITSCDTLHPEYRPAVEAAFRCRVFDNYGCNDGGAWGAQCTERDGFHQDVERGVMQFESGRMVATDLWNTAFPFIRYETGDAGSWLEGECACGRSHPRFRMVGRSTDLLVAPTGVIFPSPLNRALALEGLDDARVVQRSDRDIEVLLVPNELFDAETRRSVEDRLGPLLEGMRVSYRLVEGIPQSLSGKHRVSVNLSGIQPESIFEGSPPEMNEGRDRPTDQPG